MNKVFITVLFLVFCSGVFIPAQARERVVTEVGKTGIISNGLYFRIHDITTHSKNIVITVEAKNKSMLSQAVYLELIDAQGKAYKTDTKEDLTFFKPLKFNKPRIQKINFTVPSNSGKYWLVVYSKDIFKKNKKQIITKMPLNEAKTELNTKQQTKDD